MSSPPNERPPWRSGPLAPLAPLGTEGSANGASPHPGGSAGKTPQKTVADVVHEELEAAKCDKMCDQIDFSVNVLTLNATAHLLAAEYYYKWYCTFAIPSIAFSSIVAVMGSVLPGHMLNMVSAICNATNTIAIGLLALLRFESKSSLHTQGACTLQSLKVRQIELRDKLQQIVHGFKTEDHAEIMDSFWRSWSETMDSLQSKAQEVMEMIPIHPGFMAKAQKTHEFLFRAEMEIPCLVIKDSRQLSSPQRDRSPAEPHEGSEPPSPPASPPAPLANELQTSPGKTSAWKALRRQRSRADRDLKSGTSWVLQPDVVGGVEYSTQKLDQLRARLRLMLTQHLIASKYFMTRYYALSFPSIALSSFLTVIALIVPKLEGCKEIEGESFEDRDHAWPLAVCPSQNLGSLFNGINTILLGMMAILRHQTKADMHNNAAKNLQSLIMNVEFMRDDMTHFSQSVDNKTMAGDARTFFRGFSRRLGSVYAKVEEIQEMMPVHPAFQRQALKVHMALTTQEHSIKSLHKIFPTR